MSCGPKGSEESSILQCSVCGRRKELFELPGRSEKYCLECSADVVSSILLTTEIDAATMSGQETEGLAARRGVDSALMMYVGPVAARIFLRELPPYRRSSRASEKWCSSFRVQWTRACTESLGSCFGAWGLLSKHPFASRHLN
jgi:hypothetical protein